MQRVIKIPEGVNVGVEGFKVSVSGEKGSLEKVFNLQLFRGMKVEKKDNTVVVSGRDKRKDKAMIGTIEAHINNMIKGVTEGFTYKMKVVFVHFPITVKVSGDYVIIENFLGENKPRKARIIEGVSVKVEGDEITVTGINRESVGQTCANIEQATKVSSRDRRTFQDGIFIISKGE